MLYHVFRLVERFPNWIKSPEFFSMLPDAEQEQLLCYNFVRHAEELELATLGMARSLG